ncbi:hypothetical protein [Candidatus Odyssella acanthamoebae]|uniref:Uncharacterized protein n=1 Tax=Candidatus Odyssella acanthamoebae TaxID=91604 RepID=A0A077AYA8_9PROT|nr:hypothetical protein [Candidatus Paracaedibacter acanthamoebae]AIK95725.1 hypothetical protein ID47_01695 [Candidatus Paracaedibacter acanthamoebae]
MYLSSLRSSKKLLINTKHFIILASFFIICGSDAVFGMERQINSENEDEEEYSSIQQPEQVSLSSIKDENIEDDSQMYQPLLEVTSHLYLSINQKDIDDAVLKWLDKNQFAKFNSQPPSANKFFDRSLFAIEVFSGGASSVMFFILGYNFAERFLQITAISQAGKIVLSSLYGMTNYIPMVFLGTELSSSLINKLFYKKSQEEKLIERKITWKNYFLECNLKTPVIVAGILSASSLTYLTYDDLFPYIGWGWLVPGIPTFYVRTLIDYYSITTLSKNIYDTIKPSIDRRFARSNLHSRQAYAMRIKNVLQEARLYISSLNYFQAEQLAKIFKEQVDPLERFKVCSHPESFFTEQIQVKKDSLIKTLIGIAGGIVGGYGQWIVYPVALDSFVPLLQLVGLEDKEVLITGLAIIGTITASGLTTLATWNSTLKFYDAISGVFSSGFNYIKSYFKPKSEKMSNTTVNTEKKNRFFWKRLAAAVISGALAVCSAGPSAEIALTFLNINEVWPKVELTSAIIAVFSTSFWAVDEVLLKLLKAGDPRQPLLNTINQIILKLPDMSKKRLRKLINLLPEEGATI